MMLVIVLLSFLSGFLVITLATSLHVIYLTSTSRFCNIFANVPEDGGKETLDAPLVKSS